MTGTAPGDAGRSSLPAATTPPAQATAGLTGAVLAGPVLAGPVLAGPVLAGTERGTRAQIARLILEHGPATATALSERLSLTPAAVRRHLDNLLAEGMIESRMARPYHGAAPRRGRPARVFALTDAGRSAFEHAYDDLAASALRFLAERAGPDAVAEFARRQVGELERRYAAVVAAAPPADRVRVLAEALSADGYAASAAGAPVAGGGEQLCQHHCPVAHVAAEYPQLCEAETEAFGRLLGLPVQRLATIAHGDGVCTTHITAPSLLEKTLLKNPVSAASAAGRPATAPPAAPHQSGGTSA